MRIIFTRHAEEKFQVLEHHGVRVPRHKVEETVRSPEHVDYSRKPLVIAQISLDEEHVLRVVYKEEEGDRIIITFYPGRRSQYGSTKV